MHRIVSLTLLALCPLLCSSKANTTSTEDIWVGQASNCTFASSLTSQVNGSSSPEVAVPNTGRDCTTNVCREQGGCASCVRLDVQLPLEAKVLSVHCLTTAHYPDDSPIHEVPCTQDNAWSIFDSPVISRGPQFSVVSTVFHNRSSNRNRVVKFVLDWR
jgi:hypothetical protein